MKRRAFLAAIPALAVTPPTPRFNGPIWRAMLKHRELRNRTKNLIHLDEFAYFEGPLSYRQLYEHFYNQNPIVNRALSLHAELPISSLM